MKLGIPINNIPLADVNNFCVQYECELDLDNEMIVVMEIKNEP